MSQKNGTAYQGTFTSYITNTYGTGSGYALGAVVTSAADVWKDGVDSGAPDTLTTNVYGWYDGAVITSSSYKPDTGSSTTWSNIYTLGASGAVKAVDINDGRPRDVIFKNDVTGQAIRRDEADTNTSAGDPHSVWYRFNGREMGRITNDGTVYTDYASSIGDRQAQSGTGAFQFGAVTGRNSAEFGIAYEAINSFSQGSAGGGYVVQAGDTLAGIAQRLYGDANLWYRLAEANGLSSAAVLVEGRTLTLPPGVSRNANTAATFKPYDPAETLGNVSPTNPKPQKGPKCGMFGQFLVTFVALAAAAWLGPQMAGLFSTTTTTVALGGISGVIAVPISVTTTSLSTMGAIAAGAATGAVASAVSQGLAVATDIQDGFDWKAVGMAAIAGGVGGALGPDGAFGSKGLFGGVKSGVVRSGLQSIASSGLTQGIGVATKLQNKFSWAGVAAAGVGAGIGYTAGKAFGAAPISATNHTLGAYVDNFSASAASLIANAATRSALDGSNFGDNIMRALPDLIAQTIGDMMVHGVVNPKKAYALRQARIFANVDSLQEILGPDADLSEYRSAALTLARNPESVEARDALEYETRRVLIANRGNTAVEDFISQIGDKIPKKYFSSPDGIVVNGHRDYMIGTVVDNSGIWIGEKKKQIGSAVSEFLEEHPGAGLAARLFDTGTAAIAPVKYLAGNVLDYFESGISGWIADEMDGPQRWTTEKAQAGGDGAVFAASIAISGLGAFKGGRAIRQPVAEKLTDTRPPNMSPIGSGRHGAFNEAKRASGIPTSQQPTRTLPNVDARGNRQPGRIYEYEVPAPGGGTRTIRIRDDAGGHLYPDDPTQNRGPHMNDPKGNHYDY